MKILQQIKCFFGYHRIVAGLFEDEEIIQVKKCDCCGRGFGKMIFKPFIECVPPNSTIEQQNSWYAFCLEKWEKARNELIIE